MKTRMKLVNTVTGADHGERTVEVIPSRSVLGPLVYVDGVGVAASIYPAAPDTIFLKDDLALVPSV